jgi:hypothetical protein
MQDLTPSGLLVRLDPGVDQELAAVPPFMWHGVHGTQLAAAALATLPARPEVSSRLLIELAR